MRDQLNAALSDRYTVEHELGRGGMASVWLARDRRHDRLVAIKVLRPELAAELGVDRFLREIRLTVGLQHPNIVPVLDSGALTSPTGVQVPWFAMVYIAGESLRERIERERHLPVEDALRITEAAADALHAAHRAGIVHRDIKPENLLLADGKVYVADFGIAKAVLDTAGARLTNTGLAIGTPAYMSPEQASAEVVDARSDQYSLASVLYEMLAGEPPFTGATVQAIMARRLSESARAIRTVRPAVPEAVERAVLRALERLPADRFDDVSTFAAALRRAAPSRPARSWRSRVTVRALGVAAVLMVAALGGWRLLAGRSGDARSPAVLALYRRGTQGYAKRTPEGVRDAIDAFTLAVRQDSSFADAWAGLAKSYARAFQRRFLFPGAARDSVLRLAVSAADHALLYDSGNVDAWVSEAYVSSQLDPTDLKPAFASLGRALALDSSNTDAWHYLAMSYAESGDLDRAVTAWRRSVTLDLRYAQGLNFLAQTNYWRRQYDSAAFWADSAIAVGPTFLTAWSTLGIIALEQGRWARARAAFGAAGRVGSDVELVSAVAGSAEAAARSGARSEARRLLARADSLGRQYVPVPLHTAVFLAEAHVALGDAAGAIGWLKRYAPREDLHFQLHLRCDASLDPIAGKPAFLGLLVSDRSRPARC